MAYLKRLAKKIDKLTADQIAQQTDVLGVEEINNISYMADEKQTHLLDIYYPENVTEKLDVIIDIHGGGFICGSKEINRVFNKYMAKKDFVIVSINYSLIDGKVRFKDMVSDVFAAIHWTYNHIDQYYGSKDHFYLCGDSAGATLALMIANIANSKELMEAYEVTPFPFKQFKALAVISPSIGSLTLKTYFVAPTYREFLGNDYGKKEFDLFFPNIFVPKNYPPVYLLTAKGDFLRKDTHKLAKLFSYKNVPYKLTDREEKLGHVFCCQKPFLKESFEARHEIEAFFRSY